MRFLKAVLFSVPLLLCAESLEEALFLRRIAEFWQEGETQIVKNQIEEFIEEYPESEFSDALCTALGDLYLREKNFASGLNYYSRLQSQEFIDRTFLNRMQCLYELQWHATLADECETYLQKSGDQNLQASYFLSVALYQQCLNATHDPELLLKLAKRAQPYFERLSSTELSDELAQGFAHLCTILEEFPKAAKIYFGLAKNHPETQEELLFLAALAQAKYDKAEAINTFAQIETFGGKRAKEAAYNNLVLSFELGRYDELALAKETLLSDMPPESLGIAHLFLGRSFLTLKKYDEAINEFQAYLEDLSPQGGEILRSGKGRQVPCRKLIDSSLDPVLKDRDCVELPVQNDMTTSDTLHAALVSLLEASFQAKDISAFDLALNKIDSIYPGDPELPKAYFSRAQILKQHQKLDGARNELEQLLAKFPRCPQKSLALFELAHIDYQAKAWDSCRTQAKQFLAEFPNHELAAFAWRYLISSSAELQTKEQLVSDLVSFLKCEFLTEQERSEWQFHLAKTHYELKNYEEASELIAASTEPNASLLMALIYRDGHKELEQFCTLAEKALSQKATLIDEKEIHMALFNAYLERSLLPQSADHLFAAFEKNAEIQQENLLWLAEFYSNHLEENPLYAHHGALILEHLLPSTQTPAIICKLAKLYSILNRTDLQIDLLEKFGCSEKEAQLLLAEGYALKGDSAKALQLFDLILQNSPTLNSPISASAALQAARIKLSIQPLDRTQLAAQFKDLIIQRTLLNEPIHLEAALDYIDLQSNSAERRLELLTKTKSDFEKTDDLLSKDYHVARSKFPAKDKIYQGYMKLIGAGVCKAEAELTKDPENRKALQAKAKDLLLEIVNEPYPSALNERARQQLQ